MCLMPQTTRIDDAMWTRGRNLLQRLLRSTVRAQRLRFWTRCRSASNGIDQLQDECQLQAVAASHWRCLEDSLDMQKLLDAVPSFLSSWNNKKVKCNYVKEEVKQNVMMTAIVFIFFCSSSLCALFLFKWVCVCGVHPSAMSSKFIAERENWIECPLMWLYRWVLSSFLPPTLKYYSHPLPQLFRFRLYAWKFIDRHKCYFFNDYLTKYFELSYLLKKAKKPLLPPPSLLIFIAVLLFFLTIEHC